MFAKKPVGREAASRKYDLLTALGAFALSEDKGLQRITLRLLTLITARYNWRMDELIVGRREMARLWCVDERTVKREIARLKTMGWLEVKRPGARGRITSYRMMIDKIFEETKPAWANVGPDFEARLNLTTGVRATADGQGDVVPFPGGASVAPPDMSKGDEWSLASGVLFAEDQQMYGSWIKALTRGERVSNRLMLTAPSKFHAHYVQTHLMDRITNAVQSVDETVGSVHILF